MQQHGFEPNLIKIVTHFYCLKFLLDKHLKPQYFALLTLFLYNKYMYHKQGAHPLTTLSLHCCQHKSSYYTQKSTINNSVAQNVIRKREYQTDRDIVIWEVHLYWGCRWPGLARFRVLYDQLSPHTWRSYDISSVETFAMLLSRTIRVIVRVTDVTGSAKY